MAYDPVVQRGNAASGEVKDGDGDVLESEKKAPQGWKCMPWIIGNETFEKVASFGVLANFTVYLVKRFHMKQVVAINTINIYIGTTNFAPLLGAFISDAYCGRFLTIACASVLSFLVHLLLLLLLSSSPFNTSDITFDTTDSPKTKTSAVHRIPSSLFSCPPVPFVLTAEDGGFDAGVPLNHQYV
ncbi:hypothetical protein BHM03_00025942 [Ensete ventricosum]|nr:hypothetical protein BHM03_00025942 [Ensete ventricosum]